MGTAPNGWQTPKTDWQAADAPGPSDFNRIEGNSSAMELGQRTIDPSQAPTGVAGHLRNFLDWFANRIKAILGTTNWYDAPPTTLTAAKSHIDAAAPHSGHATTTALTAHTSAAAPHSGHETPSGAQTKVDAHAAGTNVHGATSAATANRIMMRDSAGRAKVAAPSAADDIARLDSITKTQVGLGNVTNDKQATKAEFDAKFHATTGHKHTGVAGQGPLLDASSQLWVGIGDTVLFERLEERNKPSTEYYLITRPGKYRVTWEWKINTGETQGYAKCGVSLQGESYTNAITVFSKMINTTSSVYTTGTCDVGVVIPAPCLFYIYWGYDPYRRNLRIRGVPVQGDNGNFVRTIA